MGEKRQRVGSGPALKSTPDYDLAAIIAQASAAATRGIEDVMEHSQEDEDSSLEQDEAPEDQPILFISDPHLSMRILSLPVLESLVRTSRVRKTSIQY